LLNLERGFLPRPLLLVVNQGDATVSIVDPDTVQRIGTIHQNVRQMVGHEIETSLDGTTAYLPLYGDAGLGCPGLDGDTILVLDLAKGTVKGRFTFDTAVRPHQPIRFENLLYVTAELRNAVAVIDLETMTLKGMIPTGAEQSHMLTLSGDGRFAYTSNVSSGTISVLDLKKQSLIKVLKIAPIVQRIALSLDNSTLVTSDQSEPRLALVDTNTLAIKQWISLPSPGYGSTFTQDGQTLLVTLPQAGQLAVVNLRTLKLINVVDVGPRPQEVLLHPLRETAYVSCFGSNYVAIVDISTCNVVGNIETGNKADGLRWALQGDSAA
jgi:DNA-binding beta-propeller fold protein YncE